MVQKYHNTWKGLENSARHQSPK